MLGNAGRRPSIMRVASLEDSLHRQGLASSQSGSDGSQRRRVEFGEICIRDFERIATDNPSVSRGVPIGIGWQYIQYEQIRIDDYENNRQKRTKAEMVMSADDRQWILRKEWEISQKEIAAAVRQAIKVKNQRRQTIIMEGDVFWSRVKRAMEVFEDCVKPITNAWKTDDEQLDWMDVAPEHAQTSSLDATRHRGATFIIDDEQADGSPDVAKSNDSDFGLIPDGDPSLSKQESAIHDREEEQEDTVDTSMSSCVA